MGIKEILSGAFAVFVGYAGWHLTVVPESSALPEAARIAGATPPEISLAHVSEPAAKRAPPALTAIESTSALPPTEVTREDLAYLQDEWERQREFHYAELGVTTEEQDLIEALKRDASESSFPLVDKLAIDSDDAKDDSVVAELRRQLDNTERRIQSVLGEDRYQAMVQAKEEFNDRMQSKLRQPVAIPQFW